MAAIIRVLFSTGLAGTAAALTTDIAENAIAIAQNTPGGPSPA